MLKRKLSVLYVVLKTSTQFAMFALTKNLNSQLGIKNMSNEKLEILAGIGIMILTVFLVTIMFYGATS